MKVDVKHRDRPSALILSQVYYPDVVAVAQHVTEYAEALAKAGWKVRIFCSRRAYDNPNLKYSRFEVRNGVEIVRLMGTGCGKKAKWSRAIDFASWIVACVVRLMFASRPDVVVSLTVPPLISFLGAVFSRFKGASHLFWVMDLNPDEAVAAGWLRSGSLVERVLSWMLRSSLKGSDKVVVLDRFMFDRLRLKGVETRKMVIIPPWSHSNDVCYSVVEREVFRKSNGVDGKFVVMYSGNHSPCHPLSTVLDAALKLKDCDRIVFMFIGGGTEFARVKEFKQKFGCNNILCLPYQPLTGLSASLSSADLQLVVMGDAFVGMIHPCKIYNILQLGIPFAYIGPECSHLGDLLQRPDLSRINGMFRHGDSEGLAGFILERAGEVGRRAAANLLAAEEYSADRWLPAMVEHSSGTIGDAFQRG